MTVKERAEKEELRLAIKTLIIQEIRVLQLEQAYTPSFIIDEMARSIQEIKRQVIALLRLIPPRERNALIKRVIRQSVDEEIDRAIEARKNRCLRCIHVRYFDEAGSAHENLPFGIDRARMIGCEVTRLSTEIQCHQFIENFTAASIKNYLREVTLFYEVQEMFEQFDEIWKDYFLNR